MYAELFQAPASLEEPARWLQWAQAASQGTVTPGSDAEKNTRYNLDQFWKALAVAPQTTQAERDAAARMNWWAYSTWQALADKLQWSTNDRTQQAAYAAESAQAASKKAQLQVPSLNQMNYTAASQRDLVNAAMNTTQAKAQFLDASYGTAFKDSALNLVNQPLFGVPVWIWGLGALVLVVAVTAPRR